jgi:hypothetical protein
MLKQCSQMWPADLLQQACCLPWGLHLPAQILVMPPQMLLVREGVGADGLPPR